MAWDRLLTTSQLDKCLSNNSITSTLYKGTFPADLLPKYSLFECDKPALVVVNKDSSYGSGSHWILVYLPRDRRQPTFLFDPLGDDLTHTLLDTRIKAFLERNSHLRRYAFNAHVVQHRQSTKCGAYVLAAAWLLARGVSPDSLHLYFKSSGNRTSDESALKAMVMKMYTNL